MQRVHCTSCGQTFLSDTTERCPLCRHVGGLIDPDSPQAVEDLVVRKQAESPPPDLGAGLGRAAHVASVTVRFAKLLLAGLMVVGLGILLIIHPDLRGHRGSIRLSDVWPGLGAIVAGLGIIGLACYVLKRSSAKPPAPPRAGEGKAEGG
jgi:hypothetical protein